MLSLFIDTTYNNIHIIVERDNKINASKKVANIVKISDVFNDEVAEVLKIANVNLKDIENLYLTKGPGSFTGVRVGVTFAKTLKIANPDLKVYAISSLLYQVGLLDGISYIDAKGGNVYFGVYSAGECEIPDQILDHATATSIANSFIDFYSFYDLAEFDYLQNYLDLKEKFTEIQDIAAFEPTYIKKFI